MTFPPHGEPGQGEVLRERFEGTAPDEIEAFLSAAYTTAAIRRTRDQQRLWFQHDTVTAASAGFTIAHVESTSSFHTTLPAERPSAPLIVGYLRRGRVRWSGRGHDEARVLRAGAVLPPVTGEAHAAVDPVELDAVVLDRDRVVDYAAATCGGHTAPVFTAMTPISPRHARHWATTLAHVRDDLLAGPVAATSPIVLGSCFRLLTAALLSTFPNTALAAATDPHLPNPTGGVGAVSDTTLREVVNYLDSHAGDPVGPGEITEVAGVPYRDLVAGLRRRRDTDPARELWRARLRGAHRDLHDTTHLAHATEPGAARRAIAETATRWGFGDVAAFTAAYTAATGETPEHTLRR